MTESSPQPGGAASAIDAGVRYQQRLLRILQEALDSESDNLARAAVLVADRFQRGGLLHIFGSGHSHMLAEEAFYRAGGPMQVSPILDGPYMLHQGAVRSTELERQPGHGAAVLAKYQITPEEDALLVVSNSGANALPLEIAQIAADRGLPVIAITSLGYAQSIDRPGPRLHDLADVTIDNHCPRGDALVELGAGLPNVGPASTVVGMALLNTLLVEVSARQLAAGTDPLLLRSANLEGAGEHNESLVARFRTRIPHL